AAIHASAEPPIQIGRHWKGMEQGIDLAQSCMANQTLPVGRRAFAKTLAGAAVLSTVRSSRATVHPNPPGIKIATSAPGNPTDDDLLFFQQAGVEYVSLPASPQSNAESFTKMRERYE